MTLNTYNYALTTQTEATFIKELKPANITVESRLFQTESDPVATVEDFFVRK